MTKSKWINDKVPRWKDIVRPCHYTGFCPYGEMVEMFPLQEESNERSCEVFGHDCPAYYMAEMLSEDRPSIQKFKEESDKFLAELTERERENR